MGGLAAVEGSDQGVGAAVEAVRVGVPEPDVQRHQVRVPEVEPRPRLGAALGAPLLNAGEHEGAVLVVAGRAEGPIGRARQQRDFGPLREDPLQGAELPDAPVALVDQVRPCELAARRGHSAWDPGLLQDQDDGQDQQQRPDADQRVADGVQLEGAADTTRNSTAARNTVIRM
jgi:hypothetical protein